MNRRERTKLRVQDPDHGTIKPPPAKEPTAVEHLHVKIPLKPQEKPAEFPLNFAEALKEEYAIKYLQRLGAQATAENIAMVLEHLPLDDCQITSAWRARGSLSDVVMVDLYPKSHGNVRLHGEEQESMPHRSRLTMDEQHEDSLATSRNYQVGSVCLSFDDMKHQYLLPFKHGSRQEADVLTMFAMKHEEPLTFVHIPALAEIHAKPTLQLFGRRATQRRIRCIEERLNPPELRTEFTCQLLRAFSGALPFASLGIRGDEEKDKLLSFFLHGTMVQLIEASVQYLYLEVFFKLGCLGAADLIKSATVQSYHASAPAEIETLYVTIVRLFSKIKHRMEREEKGIALYLPLHLLALRVAVDTVFRCQYPVSFSVTTPTMLYILLQMNDQLTKVLDGDELLSRIGVLETTCKSSKAKASKPFLVKKRHARLRDQFFQTSEAINTIFPDPVSGKCRKMVKFRGGAAIANYPSPVVSQARCEPISPRATSGNRADPRIHAENAAFAESARQATLPRASLETRLELLHIMERSAKYSLATAGQQRPRAELGRPERVCTK